MTIKLENPTFTAEINTKGAELQNLVRKSDKKDIIWQGDKRVWGNHAPILFPFKEGCSNIVFTSNKQPVSWRQNFTEEETLLCALDRIFDDSLIFNFNGDSHRGLKREVISLTTKKIKAAPVMEQPELL